MSHSHYDKISVTRIKGQKFDGDSNEIVNDFLTVESALQIYLNGEPFTVTMRTPGNDLELTRGLLFTEGLISIESIPAISATGNLNKEGSVINCSVEGVNHKTKRSLVSASSCGLCGKTELEQLIPEEKSLTPSSPFDINLLPSMFAQMQEQQKNFKQTGGCHAAAAFDVEGNILNCYEDIGRHNAVDKVIGDLLITSRIKNAECLLVSGRVSYEIVSKAVKASIPYLIAVSAPSSLSVEMAERAGMTLIAFCRDSRATVYTHGENIRVGYHVHTV
jgi:FdhD protein